MKKYIFTLSLFITSIGIFAQSGTNSPYSQYGLGVLSEQGNGFNRGMNGVGLALTRHNQVNYLNPASYSKTDSTSFIFDIGLSLQLTNFKEGNTRKNAKNADFEYAVGAFRLAKHFGLGFGLIPFSNIGYNYGSSGDIKDYENNTTALYTNTYNGSGGVRELFVGLGYEPLKGLSVGVNVGYLWGDYSRTVSNAYSNAYANTLEKTYNVDISSYKIDFGAQYFHNINKDDAVGIGITYGIGNSLNADPSISITSTNSQTNVNYTTTHTAKNGLSLPEQIGVGASFAHKNNWIVAADYTLQKWSAAKYPKFIENGNDQDYIVSTNMFNDRHKFNIGGEYCKNPEGRSFSSRIRYRLGAGYTSSYLKIRGLDGPDEISISAGVGIPVINSYNNRSMLNVSAQWVNSSAKSLITENTFRITVGLTFNERWFAKWKFE